MKPTCALCNLERALPRRPATVRETEEVERLRLAFAPFLPTFRRIAAEFEQAGFLRMKLEAEPLETFPQFAETALTITMLLKNTLLAATLQHAAP